MVGSERPKTGLEHRGEESGIPARELAKPGPLPLGKQPDEQVDELGVGHGRAAIAVVMTPVAAMIAALAAVTDVIEAT